MPLNATVNLWPWEHFNQEYLTQFGVLLRIQCSTLVFTITIDNRGTDNGPIDVESGKKTHKKEASHSGNKVRLFN